MQGKWKKKLISNRLIFIVLAILIAIITIKYWDDDSDDGSKEDNINVVKNFAFFLNRSLRIDDVLHNYKYFKRTEWLQFTTEEGLEVVKFEGYYYKDDQKYIITIEFIMNKEGEVGEDGASFKRGFTGYKKQGELKNRPFIWNDVFYAVYKNNELRFY